MKHGKNFHWILYLTNNFVRKFGLASNEVVSNRFPLNEHELVLYGHKIILKTLEVLHDLIKNYTKLY